MTNDTSPNQYVSRLLNKNEDDRLNELKIILSELDIGIRLRKITQHQKHEIIHEIKRAIADERNISFDEKTINLMLLVEGVLVPAMMTWWI